MMLEDLDYIESVEGIIRTQQVNAEIYRTDELGTINIVFSADDIKITY